MSVIDRHPGRTGYLALAILLTFAVPRIAEAAQSAELLEAIPGGSEFVTHVDVDALRNSGHFDRAVEHVEKRAENGGSLPAFLGNSDGVDLRNDASALAVGIPSPRQNARRGGRSTVVVEGDFDKSSMLDVLREEYDGLETSSASGTEFHRSGRRAFVWLDSGRLVAATGAKRYQRKVVRLAGGDGNSFRDVASSQGLLARIDTSRTVWAVNRSPRPTTFAMTVDSGLELHGVGTQPSKKKAKKAVKRLKSMKSSEDDRPPLVETLGASPLLDNLETSRDGSVVEVRTSMSASQLNLFIDNLARFAASRQRRGGDDGASADESRDTESNSDDSTSN